VYDYDCDCSINFQMAQVMYNVWLDKPHFDEAERIYQEHLQQMRTGGCSTDGVCMSSLGLKAAVSILKMLYLFYI